jgi:hypothetical protein
MFTLIKKMTPVLILLLWVFNSCMNAHSTKTDAIISDTVKPDIAHSPIPDIDTSDSIYSKYDTLKGADRFIGDWSKNGSMVCDCISIGKDTSIFGVSCNQLDLDCRNKFHGDTLYLYVIGSDQGRGFMGPKDYPPKPKSLFAKCYVIVTANIELKIIYTQPLFSKNIEDLELDTVLYNFQ